MFLRMTPRVTAWMFGAIALLPVAASAQTRPLDAATAADLASGQRAFDAQCAWCHGAGGTGGTGPDLHRTQLRHAANDREIETIVRGGIPGTEMPSFRFTDTAAWQVAAYVRSLGRTPGRPLPGNARHGASVYDDAGCASCHIVGGKGRALGPELTTIGSLRGAAHLREALITPEASHPRGYLVVNATPDFCADKGDPVGCVSRH